MKNAEFTNPRGPATTPYNQSLANSRKASPKAFRSKNFVEKDKVFNEAMKEFNTSCDQFFNQQLSIVIDEGINKGELIPQSKKLINGLMCFEKGVALMKMTKNDFDAKMICEEFINTLFEIIEVKK